MFFYKVNKMYKLNNIIFNFWKFSYDKESKDGGQVWFIGQYLYIVVEVVLDDGFLFGGVIQILEDSRDGVGLF